jgi:hypothetical protein
MFNYSRMIIALRLLTTYIIISNFIINELDLPEMRTRAAA